ncbi:response regulator [Comamonas sp. CAH-2]|uniref:hypothetical protein n=1 Tax=Comamonas sp. CAH-2 TaxID=2605745 RepID=UPI0012AD8DC8|nr:hypothetical protein [Comamonas sp. CAH-2]MRT20305.1 response regulator [Comamonas sp. CAH-2]
MLSFIKKKKTFEDFPKLSRQEIIRKSRILFIDDDDDITLIDFLRSQGFSIDHDKNGNDLNKYDSGLYDLIILDYYGVGTNLGDKHGLELMRYLSRNRNPARIIAYTSRSLSASEADFFKLSHAVLIKDLGLADSMEVIESELNLCFDKNLIFSKIIKELDITDSQKINSIKENLYNAINSSDKTSIENHIFKTLRFTANKAVDIYLGKIF